MSALLRRVERPACESCRAMAPEVEVPVGDGCRSMCWLCAHAVTEHGAEVGAPIVDCGCEAREIYPPAVLALRDHAGVHRRAAPEVPAAKPSAYTQAPTYVGRDSERWSARRAARRDDRD